MDLGLKGRTAIVCAASKGLGRACAEALAAEGVALVLNARDPARLKQAAAEIAAAHEVEVTAVAGDIASEAAREALLAPCPAPDILVNNAGGPAPGKLKSWTPADWSNAIESNLLAPAAMMAAVLDGMAERGFGRVVNIGSINGQAGQYGQVNYAAAKSGIHGFTKALAQEGAARGITVNAVAPGYVDTEMVRAVPAEVLEKIIARIPVGRLGKAEDIARTVLFLVADDADFITGSTLSVNGGQHMY